MNAVEFLTTIWPSTGPYCIARGPFARRDGKGTTFYHNGFDTIAEAAAYATKMSASENVFHANMSVLGYETVARQDGSSYQKLTRDHAHMVATRCFWGDADVGETKDHASQLDALKAIKAFCDRTKLPKPLINSSGRGIHFYWVVTEDIPAAVWLPIAQKIKALAIYHGLKCDTEVMTDLSRVLRTVGTFHRKDPTNPIKVINLVAGARSTLEELVALVDAAYNELPNRDVQDVVREGSTKFPKPPEVAQVCANFVTLVQHAATVTGLQWQATNMLCLHTTGGRKLAHKIGAAHPTYDFDDTEEKLDRLENQKMGPATCGMLDTRLGPLSKCKTCPNYGAPTSSPVVFARRLPETELPNDLPPPRLPYLRTKRGIEYQTPVVNGVQLPPTVILDYDFYPTLMIDESRSETKSIVWTAVVPHKGEISFKLPADIYGNEDRLVTALANKGIVVDKRHAKQLGGYVSHYIKLLQNARLEEPQVETAGWNLARDSFNMGRINITAEGDKPAIVSSGMANMVAILKPGGTMQGQIDALKFYNFPQYIPQQFYLGLSLGAILLHEFNLYGMIGNIAGESGASKTTCIYAGGGMYGEPKRYVMSAGETEATRNFKANRIRLHANLVVMQDEITLLSADSLKAMVMSITQPESVKGTLTRTSEERAMPDTLKSTVMICTSNTSGHALLADRNAAGSAGSMRMFETWVARQTVHTKTQADRFLAQLHEHYGWVGPAFIRYVLANRAKVSRELKALLAEVDAKGHIDQSERYWAAAIAVSVYALRIARELGLLFYDPEAVLNWALYVQLPNMRRIVGETYAEPLDTIQAYLDSIVNNLLVMNYVPSQGIGKTNVTYVWETMRTPMGSGGLKARLDVHADRLWISTQGLREYCDVRKLPFDTTVQHLVGHKVATREKMRLGRYNAAYPGGSVWTLCIDLTHESMSGRPPLVADGNVVHAFPSKPAAKG